MMSNFGLEVALADRRVPVRRAKVGDRYVMEALDQEGWCLGGEASGHLVCLDCTSTGDGTISALQVLAALSRQNLGLRDAAGGMEKMPQTLNNVRGDNRADLDGNDAVQSAIRDVEKRLNGKGRVLLRPSGTEPVVRVMVEGEDAGLVSSLCEELAGTVERVIS